MANPEQFQVLEQAVRAGHEAAILPGIPRIVYQLPAARELNAPRAGVAGLNATTRLKVWEIQPVCVPGIPITPTVRSGLIEEQKQRDIGLTTKKGAVSLDGFANMDMVAIETDIPIAGLCLDQVALRAVLLLDGLAWRQGWECSPQAMLSLFDPNVLGMQIDPAFEVNSSPVFGESCGGTAAPEYPFGGGVGSLRIHLSLLSVAEEGRPTALYMPNGVLGACDPSKTFAIMLMLLSEWPSCLFGYRVSSSPNPVPEGYPEGCSYGNFHMASQSLVHVPGPRHLNIILPSQLADISGRNQPSTIQRWTIKSGPRATIALPANSDIRYCGRPAANNDWAYGLTDFIVSWIEDIRADDVLRVLNKLNEVMPLESALTAMRDIMVITCYQFPKLTLGTQDAYPTPCRLDNRRFTTRVLMDYAAGSGLAGHQLQRDFPTAETFTGDFLTNAFDFVAWNQVILRLAHVNIADHVRMPVIRPEYVNKAVLMCNVARTILLAIPWHVMLQWQGAGCKSWLTHRVNMNSSWIPTLMPLCYGELASTIEESLAPAGFCYPNIMWVMSGCRPTTVTWTFENGASRPMTVYDRACYTGAVATVYDSAGVEFDGYVPTVLVDSWIHVMSKYVPRGWLPFPPPAKIGAPTTVAIFDGMISSWLKLELAGVHYVSSLFLGPELEYYPTSTIWREEDWERWNKRLFISGPTAFRITDIRGTNLDGFNQEGKLPWLRCNNLRGDDQYPIEQLGQSTLCVPHFNYDAKRVFVIMVAGDGDRINCTGSGTGHVDRAVWLRTGIQVGEVHPYEIGAKDDWKDFVKSTNLGFRTAKSVAKGQDTGGVQPPPKNVEPESLEQSTPQ
nr:MAG: putative capsid protein [Vaasa toti-like virus]